MPNMGQHLFRPPSVAGWGTNGYWVSTAATWAKAAYALQMRKIASLTGVLSDVVALSPHDAANRGFEQMGIINPTVRTRASWSVGSSAVAMTATGSSCRATSCTCW